MWIQQPWLARGRRSWRLRSVHNSIESQPDTISTVREGTVVQRVVSPSVCATEQAERGAVLDAPVSCFGRRVQSRGGQSSEEAHPFPVSLSLTASGRPPDG